MHEIYGFNIIHSQTRLCRNINPHEFDMGISINGDYPLLDTWYRIYLYRGKCSCIGCHSRAHYTSRRQKWSKKSTWKGHHTWKQHGQESTRYSRGLNMLSTSLILSSLSLPWKKTTNQIPVCILGDALRAMNKDTTPFWLSWSHITPMRILSVQQNGV